MQGILMIFSREHRGEMLSCAVHKSKFSEALVNRPNWIFDAIVKKGIFKL